MTARGFDSLILRPAQSRIIADLGERVALGLGVSPDGRTILFTRADNPSSDLMMVENFR